MRFWLFVAGTFVLGTVIGGLVVYAWIPKTSMQTPQEAERLREGVVTVSNHTSSYTNDTLGFTLSYPKELSTKEYDEGGGALTIVFEGSGEQNGFQMFVVPYTGDTITETRIKQDLGGASIEEPVEIILPGNTKATMFWSTSPAIGRSREVWFIKNGYLFEVTTYAAKDTWLAGILNTLTFN